VVIRREVILLVEPEIHDKIMPMAEAIKKFVQDGSSLGIASVGEPSPMSAIHEVVRQKKRNLTVIQAGSSMDIETLVATGCVKRFISSYVYRVTRGERAYDRGLKKYNVEVEDYTNYTAAAMLMASAMGLSCFPAPMSLVCSDIYRQRSFLGENKIKLIDNPFRLGEKLALVPAFNPDVSVVHVQRVDKFGNAQAWGPLTNMKWGALAARKIIVSAEELVDHDVVKLSPNNTIIPGFRTSAICIEPFGGHPSGLTGYYEVDFAFGMVYVMSSLAEETYQDWLNEWIFGVANRAEYIEHYIEKYGYNALERIKVQYYPSSTVKLGGTFKSYTEAFGITQEMMEQAPEFLEVEVE